MGVPSHNADGKEQVMGLAEIASVGLQQAIRLVSSSAKQVDGAKILTLIIEQPNQPHHCKSTIYWAKNFSSYG